MNNKSTVTILITIVFVVAVAVFEFIRFGLDTTPSVVDPTYLQAFDSSLESGFIEDLTLRQGNEVGPDLGY